MSELNLNDIFVLKEQLEDIASFTTLQSRLNAELNKYRDINSSYDEDKEF